jgi:hypothetical protein
MFSKGKKIKGRDLRSGMKFRTKRGAYGTVKTVTRTSPGMLMLTFDGPFMRPDGGFSNGPVDGFGEDEDFWEI